MLVRWLQRQLLPLVPTERQFVFQQTIISIRMIQLRTIMQKPSFTTSFILPDWSHRAAWLPLRIRMYVREVVLSAALRLDLLLQRISQQVLLRALLWPQCSSSFTYSCVSATQVSRQVLRQVCCSTPQLLLVLSRFATAGQASRSRLTKHSQELY